MNANDVLEQILHLSCRMAETRDLQPLFTYAVDVALDLFNAEHGYLILRSPDGSLDFRVKRQRHGSEITKPEISRQILDSVLSEGQPVTTADALKDPLFDTSPSVHALNLRSVMCVPLIAQENVFGALYLDNRLEQNAFTATDLKFLHLFANQAAVSIENAILNEELEERIQSRTAELQEATEEVKRSEQRYRTLFEAAFEGICVHEGGVLLDANPAFAKLFGYSHAEIVGISVFDLVAEESRELVRDKVISEDERPYKAIGLKKDGAIFDAELLGKKYAYEGRPVRVTALRDITERKKIERHQIELALEQERIRILTNFIAQASHEFRTPLSVIGTNAFLLKKVADSEKQKQYARFIEEQVRHIAELVNNMVALSKLDSGEQELSIEEVELNAIVRATYQKLTSQHHEKRIKIILDLSQQPIHLPGDPVFLQQAIETILYNAISFTPVDGVITLQTVHGDDHAVLYIRDTGIGIDEDALPHIFERFYRVDAAGTTRGFGLGLSIAKAIVDKHRGQVEVDSQLDQGSVFSIWLPTVRG